MESHVRDGSTSCLTGRWQNKRYVITFKMYSVQNKRGKIYYARKNMYNSLVKRQRMT